MSKTEYNFDNGFWVDIKTGNCLKEPFFITDIKSWFVRDGYRNAESLYNGIQIIYNNTNHKNARLNKLEKWALKDDYMYILKRTVGFINLLQPKIAEKQRSAIWNYLLIKKPKRIKQAYMLIIKYIIDNDLPLTTKELLKSLKQILHIKSFFNIRKYIKESTIVRKYYWYIIKKLNSINDLVEKDKNRFYNCIKAYYDIIRFKLLSSANPINIINFLVYCILNQHATYISKVNRSQKALGIMYNFRSGTSEKLLQKINLYQLDKSFLIKINFNKDFRGD